MPTSYPKKLQKPSTISDRVRNTAETFILDSGIGDDVSNQEVIELAEDYEPEYVIPKDYLHEQTATTESVREFMTLFTQSYATAKPLIPLQPPFDKHYKDLSGYDRYVLGGMADASIDTAKQIEWIRDFRRVAPDVYAHGLGVGGGIEFVQKVAPTSLLDSIDCSTPEQAAQFGSVLDERLRQQQVRVMSGEGASKRNYALGEFNSYQLQDVWDRESKKNGLEAYQ